MSEEKMVIITMTRGEFIYPAWREAGTVLEVEQRIANRWIDHKSAVLGGTLGEDVPQQEPSQLGSFPSAEIFERSGFVTMDSIKALITEKGDAWPKSVKGMTKPLAAKVSEALEAMANKSAENTTAAEEVSAKETPAS